MADAVPLIRRSALLPSFGLAILAEGLFIAVQILHRGRAPMLFILTVGWPFYYAICLGFGIGLASRRRQGPPGWLIIAQVRLPSLPIRRLWDLWISFFALFALFAFPTFGVLLGAVCIYAETTNS